jgi:hypothetical protein
MVFDGLGVRIMLSGMAVVSKVMLRLAVGSMSNGVGVNPLSAGMELTTRVGGMLEAIGVTPCPSANARILNALTSSSGRPSANAR